MAKNYRFPVSVCFALILAACGPDPQGDQPPTTEQDAATSHIETIVGADYPDYPDDDLTPGSLCTHPDEYRYPEQIPYCKRRVSSRRKWDIIEMYEAERGYHIKSTGRHLFKIDHLVPLCFGGSNDTNNLWPQHESVYRQTDSLEQKLCEKLQQGRIKQKVAIAWLLEAKHDFSTVTDIHRRIANLGKGDATSH